MNGSTWIWQQPDWPAFRWQDEPLAPLLRACRLAQGRLIGAAGVIKAEFGIATYDSMPARVVDVARHHGETLDLPRLLHWHALLVPADDRFPGPHMRTGLEESVNAFLAWFASSLHEASLDPLLRAGIAHFWFVTLHPFDDGNGRLARAITDLALAQAEHQAIRFYTMSSSILDDCAGYCDVLEASQRAGLDVTPWLEWFLRTLLRSLEQALAHIDRVLDKAHFWRQYRAHELSAEQVNVLNRLLDGGDRGFPLGINASLYQTVAKVSKATATRHLTDLLDKGLIERLPGGGRSTRYRIAWPEQRDA